MNQEKCIRVLIVDDESLARERIRDLLRGEADVEVVGECGNGKQAVDAIKSLKPDLLFLDVQMPGLDGFSVLERAGVDSVRNVIFVTAYDRYALKAFEVYALDYLLKPFDRERFVKSLSRARSQIERERADSLNDRLSAVLDEMKNRPRYLERLVIKSSGRVLFLRTDEIDWIEAEGNYVRLHVGKESRLMRETITSLENQLDPRKFVRIHRSTIVNLDRVEEMQPWFHGEYCVKMTDGTQVMLSRSYRDRLKEALGRAI